MPSTYRDQIKQKLPDVRVEQLNRQHQELVDHFLDFDELVEKLQASPNAVPGWSGQVDAFLAFLTQFTRGHFEAEEYIMREHRFQGLADHQKSHQALIERLKEIQAALKTDRSLERVVELRSFLVDWLLNHTCNEDIQYADYFKQRGLEQFVKV